MLPLRLEPGMYSFWAPPSWRPPRQSRSHLLEIGGRPLRCALSTYGTGYANKRTSSQTNVKGTMVAAQAFLPTANPSHATILGVTTGTVGLPPAMLTGISAYISSKLAQVKFLEFLAAENPNIFVASVHPGMVETDIFKKSGAKAEALPMDKGRLSPTILFLSSQPGCKASIRP